MNRLLLTLDWFQLIDRDKPFFIYFESELKRRAEELRSCFPKAQLFYSIKSNPNQNLIQWINPLFDGFDISSEAELDQLMNLGVSESRITFSGPGKSDRSLLKAAQRNLKSIHLDSFDEGWALEKHHCAQPFTLRLSSPQKMAVKLGFTDSEAHAFLKSYTGNNLLGLHCYLGRESYNEELFHSTHSRMINFFETYKSKFVSQPEIFIGPGLSNTQALTPIESSFGESYPYHRHYELGRSLVASCGLYGVKVLSRKVTDSGRILIIVEGGLQHLGGPIQSYRDTENPISVKVIRDGRLLEESDQISTSIYGSLCLGHDCLITHLMLPRSLQRGDWLLFNNCGAYGLSAGVSSFIGQTLPQEYGINTKNQCFDFTHKNFNSYLNFSEPG